MNAGKGDRVRAYNRKRWDEGWDRAYGKERCRYDMLLPCEGCYFEGEGVCIYKAGNIPPLGDRNAS